jgi:hypothetical protein
VHIGGSVAKLLAVEDSDLDLYIELPAQDGDGMAPEEQTRYLKALYPYLERAPWTSCLGAYAMDFKRVPLLPFYVRRPYGISTVTAGRTIKVDVCIRSPQQMQEILALKHEELEALEHIGADDARYLIVLLKSYLKHENLSEGARGGLTGTCITHLVGDFMREMGQQGLSLVRSNLAERKYRATLFSLLLDRLCFDVNRDTRISISGSSMMRSSNEGDLLICNPLDTSVNMARSLYRWKEVRAALEKLQESMRDFVMEESVQSFCPRGMWEKYVGSKPNRPVRVGL